MLLSLLSEYALLCILNPYFFHPTSGLLQRQQKLMAHSMSWVAMMEEITWSKISFTFICLL